MFHYSSRFFALRSHALAKLIALPVCLAALLAGTTPVPAVFAAEDRSVWSVPRAILIAAKTESYGEKEGFHRDKKDIINTLKNNEVTSFQTLLDALQQAFELDKTLRGEGPFTVFAPSDKAWKKVTDADMQTLFGDKNKLKRTLQYHIVAGKKDAAALRSGGTLKTLEGHDLTVTQKGSDLLVNGVLVSTTDIPCTNGVIHVVERVVMLPASN